MTIAKYIRLSLADEETGTSKKESDSIVGQRMSIELFLSQQQEFATSVQLEFVDDGFTATNGNRPAFMRMMEGVRSGQIQMIVVRDFSRFFRDYIEAGNYLECVFPFLGVRFISINDHYDSNDYKGTTGGLEMAIRNIIYASYSKDLSIKTTAAKVHMMKQGKYVGGYAPYGYEMHPTKKHALVIDPVASKVIRRIFDEVLSSKNVNQIAIDLNRDQIPTIAQHFKANHPNTKKFIHDAQATWTPQRIYCIARKQLYTGAMVSHVRKQVKIGSRKTVPNTPIIVENMHQAIVSKEEFELAQNMLQHSKRNRQPAMLYPLKSLVKCGYCGHVICRRRKSKDSLYLCSYQHTNESFECCSVPIAESDLDRLVYNAISQYAKVLNDRTVTHKKPKTKDSNPASQLLAMHTQENRLKQQKILLYEQFTSSLLSKAAFLSQKNEVDQTIKALQERRSCIEREMNAPDPTPSVSSGYAQQLISLFSQTDHITYDLTHAFIKTIYIHDENHVEIEWKFKDEFQDILPTCSC